MILTRLSFVNLRNHERTEFDCSRGVLFLWGRNGAGKTTVLEAVSVLCMTKSFVTPLDRTLLRQGSGMFRVAGFFRRPDGVEHEVAVEYPDARRRKTIRLDGETLPSATDLIGKFPLVVLSPQHRPLVQGGPGERRRFLDAILSQARHSYLLDLVEYQKVLRQRNALLAQEDLSPMRLRTLLEPWNEALARLASRITSMRAEFVEVFTPRFLESYRVVASGREEVALRYDPSAPDADGNSSPDAILRRLEETAPQEFRRGQTLVGPHRDELAFLLNGLDVRQQASQGQSKTVMIALKMAEFFHLEESLREKPILLLDDVFSELDRERLANVLELVRGAGQTFITSVEGKAVEMIRFSGPELSVIEVAEGEVRRIKDE